MKELARTLSVYDTVRSMKGCGDKLKPRIIAEIGDIRKFKMLVQSLLMID